MTHRRAAGALGAVLFAIAPAPAASSEVTVRYHRFEGDYAGWSLWTWNAATGASREVFADHVEESAAVFRVDLEALGGPDRLGLLPRRGTWDHKDDPDRFWTPSMGSSVWIVQGDGAVHAAEPDLSPRVVRAWVDAPDRVRLVLSKSVAEGEIHAGVVTVREAGGRAVPVRDAAAIDVEAGRSKVVDVTLAESLAVERIAGGVATIGAFRPAPLRARRVLDSLIDDGPLGWTIEGGRTTFRVWAPTARTVEVAIWDAPAGGEPRIYPMTRTPTGAWEATIEEDLAGRYYLYRVTHPQTPGLRPGLHPQTPGLRPGLHPEPIWAMDPYSRANTAPTPARGGRCAIFRDTTPVAPGPRFGPAEAIVYEVHIRDFTIDPALGLAHPGKYLGMAEETSIARLGTIGANVVQIMPFQMFDHDEASGAYNWGYMPFHFNAPSNWYATARDGATAVREAKRMIDALHRAGLRVVMDVVYNHTAEGNPDVRVSFNALVPDYYYRTKDDGSYWNGSGTGNEFRTEAPMARRFIVDSLLYWVDEYDVDGFRFDLMGLIDMETMRAIMRALRARKPDILVWGEPWAGGATPIEKTEAGKQRNEGFAVFDASLRDALRGPVFEAEKPGWLVAPTEDAGAVARIKRGVMGSITDFAAQPTEAIHYAEAHDNHTLHDRLARTSAGRLTEADLVRLQNLAAAVILTSQGIPFLHAGQEVLRTKGGEDNTYNKPDSVNMIRRSWDRENAGALAYHAGLVRLRRAHPLFRQATADEVHRNLFLLDDHLGLAVPPSCVGYVVHKGSTGDAWEAALVLFNPTGATASFDVPRAPWTPVANDARAGVEPLGPPVETDRILVAPRSAAILYTTDAGLHARALAPMIDRKMPRMIRFAVSAPQARRVTLAGEFNAWNMNALEMRRGPDGAWEVEVPLAPGTYEYKFVADGDWDALNRQNRRVTVPP